MKRICVIMSVILLAGLCSVFGRVFRVRDVPPGHVNTLALGWESAYQTTMNVNGVHQELYVYSADANYPVARQLEAQFEGQGAEVDLQKSADGFRGIAQFKDRQVRILVLSGKNRPNHLIFLFHPKPGETAGRPTMPIPEFPGAVDGQLVTNDKSGAICRTLTTEADSAQVLAFYATALSADGWSTVLPSGSRPTRMAVFQKGKQTCSVLAADNPDGLNRVTVLVNGGAF